MENNIDVGQEILYLTLEDIERIQLNEEKVFEIVEGALAEHGRKNCEMPAKIGLHPLKDTLMHAMPAFIPKFKACGIKWASCFPENHKYNLAQTSGLLVLNDQNTGWPIAVMDAIWITAKRTAAVTRVACKYLAREDSEQLGIIGTGVQGNEHIKVLPKVLPNLRTIKAYDMRADAREEFVKKYNNELDCNVEIASNYKEAVADSDVIVSATAILQKPDPQIKDKWIKERGVFIAPVDFDSLWEFATMSRMDKFLVDSIDEMNYFESIGYLPHGLPPSLHGEIGEVVAGLKPGRETDEENIMDMNIGMAVEDMPVAKELYRQALKNGIGKKLPL